MGSIPQRISKSTISATPTARCLGSSVSITTARWISTALRTSSAVFLYPHGRSFTHVLTVPGDSEAGANTDGDIVFENLSSDDVATIIHEVGHSLDKFAYDEQLSFSSDWVDKTSKDKSVPNTYAGSSAIEDVAESSIVATYNMLVPGGFPKIESRWVEVRNQYETVQTWQREKANTVMRPGGSCRKRFKNSATVERPSTKRLLRGRWAPWRRSPKPDTTLPKGIEVIQPGHFESGRCVRKH